MILCDDIEFGYPRSSFRLAIPQLKVADGEKAALVGASGSGKTTLLDLIAGVRTPERGRVVVGERVVSQLSDRARRRFRLQEIGFVFQNFELFGYLTVRENILFPVTAGGGPRRDHKSLVARLTALAEMVGIEALLDRRTDRLSRGEQQRTALCRALLHEPRVLLADEPTGNLDPGNKKVVMRLLLDLAKERGVTLIAATHDESLLPMFDRVIDISAVGTPA